MVPLTWNNLYIGRGLAGTLLRCHTVMHGGSVVASSISSSVKRLSTRIFLFSPCNLSDICASFMRTQRIFITSPTSKTLIDLFFACVFCYDNNVAILRHFGKSVLQTVYGFEDETTLDYFMAMNQGVSEATLSVGIPGTWWIDFLPWLKHVPSWMPGATFRKQAAHFRKSVIGAIEEPFQTARLNTLVRGTLCYKKTFTHASLFTRKINLGRLFRSSRVLWIHLNTR